MLMSIYNDLSDSVATYWFESCLTSIAEPGLSARRGLGAAGGVVLTDPITTYTV